MFSQVEHSILKICSLVLFFKCSVSYDDVCSMCLCPTDSEVNSSVDQWCKQDQILKTKTKTKTKTAAFKTKTKLTRPRPLEVNKGTWWI